MDKRATLSIVLLVIGLGTSVIVATGFGADASKRRPSNAPAPPEGTFLSDVASPAELKLWNARGCVTCHGAEARGTPMGPDLTGVLQLYVARFGPAEAKSKLAAYLIDPERAPRLRDDGKTYPNPMPAIEKLFGGRREDADTLADVMLRLAK